MAYSITSRAVNLLGPASLPAVFDVARDGGTGVAYGEKSFNVTLPFEAHALGVAFTLVGIGANSLLTLGAGYDTFGGWNASNPPVPGIHIDAADWTPERIYAGAENGGATFRIRYEGFPWYSTPANLLVWEVTFSAAVPGQILIDMGTNPQAGTGASGVTDGAVYQAMFANGTLNAGYTFYDDAPASVAGARPHVFVCT